MKCSRIIGAGLLVIYAIGSAIAAGPPGLVGRPTPPACCADGICYPNPTTWGSYPTRWRRWPADGLAPTPADAAAPARPSPDLRPFEAPPKEEEERRAPPPTPAPEPESPDAEGGVTRPPTTPPAETPETSPLTPPGGGLEPPTRLPFEDDETTQPQDDLPFGQPMGDHDPPPAPPFRATSAAKATVLQRVERPAASPNPVRRGVVPSRASSSDDPPPAFPLTLG
jgi:hypothetical protein